MCKLAIHAFNQKKSTMLKFMFCCRNVQLFYLMVHWEGAKISKHTIRFFDSWKDILQLLVGSFHPLMATNSHGTPVDHSWHTIVPQHTGENHRLLLTLKNIYKIQDGVCVHDTYTFKWYIYSGLCLSVDLASTNLNICGWWVICTRTSDTFQNQPEMASERHFWFAEKLKSAF